MARTKEQLKAIHAKKSGKLDANSVGLKNRKVRNVLQDVFNTFTVEFQGRSSQGKLTYALATEDITPQKQLDWSKKFPEGSSYHISKRGSAPSKFLDVTVDVSDKDFKRNSSGA